MNPKKALVFPDVVRVQDNTSSSPGNRLSDKWGYTWASSKVQTDSLPNNPVIRQQNLRQIMIGEVVEVCDVKDTIDDGGIGECGSSV